MFKTVLQFSIILIFSFLVFESTEWILEEYFEFNLEYISLGWFGLVLFWGFKSHLLCCLVPAIWAGYKCRHKSCKHDYCGEDKK